MIRQKDTILGDEFHRSAGAQYTTREEQRAITDSSKRNEVAGTKQKWYSVVDMSSSESQLLCCKEEYCIAT